MIKDTYTENGQTIRVWEEEYFQNSTRKYWLITRKFRIRYMLRVNVNGQSGTAPYNTLDDALRARALWMDKVCSCRSFVGHWDNITDSTGLSVAPGTAVMGLYHVDERGYVSARCWIAEEGVELLDEDIQDITPAV